MIPAGKGVTHDMSVDSVRYPLVGGIAQHPGARPGRDNAI
jgi:hypothetical protein